MKSLKKRSKNRRGIVFVLSMIFLAILASLSVTVATMSSANAQMASNHKRGNQTLTNAQSGVEIARYFLDGMDVAGTYTATSLNTAVQAQLTDKGLTGITATCTDSTTINLASVALDSNMESFSSVINLSADKWQIDAKGASGTFERTIRANFNITGGPSTIFDFGVATKGPLDMSGQAAVTSTTLSGSDVYIDTSSNNNSVELGSKNIVDGNIYLVGDSATYDISKGAQIGGDTITENIDGRILADAENANVHLNAAPVSFPTPNPEHFRQFATGGTFTGKKKDYWDGNKDIVLKNIYIPAGTNYTFAAGTKIQGVLFIEQPSEIKFAGRVDVTGVIVGNSQVGVNYNGSSTFDFSGQVVCHDASTLVGEEFDLIKKETGTFLMAPGSEISFSGQATTISGAIACSGASFTGQAGGTINGSLINYSTKSVVMSGQGHLEFNRTGTGQSPAGFAASYRLNYARDSYQELRN